MKKVIILLLLIIGYVGAYSQSGNLKVNKLTAKDSIKAKTVTITGEYTLPSADSTSGYLVKTDGSGQWTYVSPSGVGQDSIYVSYCNGCAIATGWKLNGDTLKIDTSYVNKIIKDSFAAHIDLITDLDTGKVSTSGDNMYGNLINSKNIQGDTIKYNVLFPEITQYFSKVYGSLYTTTSGDSLTIGKQTHALQNLDVVGNAIISNSLGIGLNVPTTKLDVVGDAKISTDLTLNKFGITDRPVLSISNAAGLVDTTHTIDIETNGLGTLIITDSITIGGVTNYSYGGDLLDDASISFPLNSFGNGTVYVFNAGTYVEYCKFILNINGSFILENHSANVANSNTDGNVCLYTNSIQNRLGGTRYFIIQLLKN